MSVETKAKKARTVAFKRSIKRAQQFARKFVKPNTSPVDELIAERREAARKE